MKRRASASTNCSPTCNISSTSIPACRTTNSTVQPLAEDIGVKINGTDLIQILLNLTVNAFQCSQQAIR